MKPKYLRQSNFYSCSIYAVINALVHINVTVEEKKLYKQLFKILNVKEGIGCTPKDFDKGLRKTLTWAVKKKSPKLKDIQVPAIIGMDYMGFAHVGLIIKKTKSFVTLVNWGSGYPLVRRISNKKFKEWCSEWCVVYEF